MFEEYALSAAADGRGSPGRGLDQRPEASTDAEACKTKRPLR